MLEFPPGCVIFLPSALLRHFNVHSSDFVVVETEEGVEYAEGVGEFRGSIVLFSQANVFMLAETGYTAEAGRRAGLSMKCAWTLDDFYRFARASKGR